LSSVLLRHQHRPLAASTFLSRGTSLAAIDVCKAVPRCAAVPARPARAAVFAGPNIPRYRELEQVRRRRRHHIAGGAPMGDTPAGGPVG
jgi:hypothetical protein